MKDLHYSGAWNLPVDQILSLLVLNKSNYIIFYKEETFFYSLISLSIRLDDIYTCIHMYIYIYIYIHILYTIYIVYTIYYILYI